MADEKLNTGPAENTSPEAAEPITTPEQAAASEPRQEHTGPTIPEPGDVVVSFDKINELKRTATVLTECYPASLFPFIIPSFIFSIALIRTIFSRRTSSTLPDDSSTDWTSAFFHSARRHQMAASYFRQSQFSAVIHHLFHRHSRLLCDLRKFRSRKPQRPHLLPGSIKRRSFKNTIHADAISSDIPFNTQRLHLLPPFLCPG